jgi:type I restriction enzyme S subunit
LISNVDKKSKDGEAPVRICNYTDVYYGDRITPYLDLMAATAPADQVRRFRLREGDVLITKDSETAEDIGVPAFVEGPASDLVCGYHLAIIRPSDIDGRYLYWAMSSDDLQGQLTAGATGVTRYGLRAETIGNAEVSLPSPAEQREIADYLDTETARIDALIAKKGRIATLLKLRFGNHLARQLAEVSAEHVALGRFIRALGQGWSPQAENSPADVDEWGVLKLSAVKAGRYQPWENKALTHGTEPDPRLVPQRGDLLITRANTPDLVGDVCAVNETVQKRMLSDLIYRIQLDGKLAADYAAYALQSARSRFEISAAARGSSQSMVKLRGEDLKQIRIPVPPPDEQLSTVRRLDGTRRDLERLVSKIEHQTSLLTERRQALITAAVTGELKVPGVTA